MTLRRTPFIFPEFRPAPPIPQHYSFSHQGDNNQKDNRYDPYHHDASLSNSETYWKSRFHACGLSGFPRSHPPSDQFPPLIIDTSVLFSSGNYSDWFRKDVQHLFTLPAVEIILPSLPRATIPLTDLTCVTGPIIHEERQRCPPVSSIRHMKYLTTVIGAQALVWQQWQQTTSLIAEMSPLMGNRFKSSLHALRFQKRCRIDRPPT